MWKFSNSVKAKALCFRSNRWAKKRENCYHKTENDKVLFLFSCSMQFVCVFPAFDFSGNYKNKIHW